MEIEPHERENQSPANSPTSTTTIIQTPPLTPKPISRSDPNPTTFIQADSNNFKQVVQMLTGSSNPTTHDSNTNTNTTKTSIPPIKTCPQKKHKLFERRNILKQGLMINPNNIQNSSTKYGQRYNEILSPSILDFPSLVLSPVTPLSVGNSSEEDKAIMEKGFYLHPSPRAATDGEMVEPRLLPLFPMTSPRVATSPE